MRLDSFGPARLHVTLGHGAPLHMNSVNREGFRAARIVALAFVGVFGFYVATVGSIAAIGRFQVLSSG
jgi:hypothetical protein